MPGAEFLSMDQYNKKTSYLLPNTMRGQALDNSYGHCYSKREKWKAEGSHLS